MEDTLWIEIADCEGEIFDIFDEEEDDEVTFNAFLASNWDF